MTKSSGAGKKLSFYWRDKEYMVLTALMPRIGLEYPNVPGANAYKGIVIWGMGKYLEAHMTKDAYEETVDSGKKFLDREYAARHFAESEKLREEYDAFIKEARGLDAGSLSNAELIEMLERLWEIEVRGMAFFSASQQEPLIAAEERLRELLSSKYSKQETNKIIETLLAPAEFDKAQQQEFDWVELVNSKDGLAWDDFLAHGTRYPFIFRNNYHLENSFENLKKRFGEDKRQLSELLKHASELRDKKGRVIEAQGKILREIGNEEVDHLAWLLQRSALERMDLKYTWAGPEDFLFHDLFKEVAGRIGEDYESMVDYYRPEDIIDALEGRGKLPDEEIENRRDAFFLGAADNESFFYSGKEAVDEAKKQYPELFEITEAHELKGKAACLGKARGEVVLVFPEGLDDLADLSKNFKEGQILVTAMTQPNMVPLMKMAGAIVTDEGGLISHAAVVSREFSIPCIVGTHKATKVFRTGDIVEVDANAGVVRLLKRR